MITSNAVSETLKKRSWQSMCVLSVIHHHVNFCYSQNNRTPLIPLYGYVPRVYTETSLIRASLIRMPHNPNTVSGNLSFSIYTDSVIRMFHNPNTWVPSCSDKRGLTIYHYMHCSQWNSAIPTTLYEGKSFLPAAGKNSYILQL